MARFKAPNDTNLYLPGKEKKKFEDRSFAVQKKAQRIAKI